MDGYERQVFRLDGRHHAHADEQHGKDANGHKPVKPALERSEALDLDGGHGFVRGAVRG